MSEEKGTQAPNATQSASGSTPAMQAPKANMKVCKSCGTQIAKSAKSCPSCGAKNGMPTFVKVIIIIVAVIALFGIGTIACSALFVNSVDKALNAPSETIDQTTAGDKTADTDTGATQPAEEPAEEAPAVIIGKAEYGKDYEGKPTITVNYEWTNTTGETASLIWTYDIKAFQNGVELETSIFADDWLKATKKKKKNWTDSTKDVKAGATISTAQAYVLDDKSAPVDIEVTPTFDFGGETVVTKKTFTPK